ncbi:MAG TPA: PspC domain-containing protein [Flavobacteriaceae bacterium]|nr:PspC domain-containing protein [Flavobacteriaceae bacterium]
MNKTVNVNLAGVFFHIDEDAFLKLHKYLDSIRQSIKDPQGRDEIIHDIEARIAELFQEKLQPSKQVVSLQLVEEVILIMGQPEDYMVDDELFEDGPAQENTKTTTDPPKKLFRDTENSYIAGVSSGLGHYLGIDPIWVRLLWILLVFFSAGTFILAYAIFWIFVPEAQTTSEKLHMRGEPVNISNIEKKVKEGFDSMADRMKGVDYEKYGKQAKSGATTFFDSLGKLILFCLKIFVKLIGIVIILIAGSTLIALFFALFGVGLFGVIDAPWIDYVNMANIGAPLWLLSLFSFFAIAIPFVFLFILGLKILVQNLKSIGTTAKLVLLGLWLISIFALGFLGIRQATERAFDGEIITTENIPIGKNDTLYLNMSGNKIYGESLRRDNDFKIKEDENGNKILFSRDVQLTVRSTSDSIASLEILKSAVGSSDREATINAKNIAYTFDFQNNILNLDGYFTSPPEDHFREQEVDIILYMPVGSVLFPDEKTHHFHNYNGILARSTEGHFLRIKENSAECLNCPLESSSDSTDGGAVFETKASDGSETVTVKIDETGISINHEKPKTAEHDSVFKKTKK